MRITCSKSELRKFKVRAGKHYHPHEYMEMLFGICGRSKTGCDILVICPVPHVGGKHQCHSTDEIWDQHVEDIAEETGLTFLGSTTRTTETCMSRARRPPTTAMLSDVWRTTSPLTPSAGSPLVA
jgi:hypothetical protein